MSAYVPPEESRWLTKEQRVLVSQVIRELVRDGESM